MQKLKKFFSYLYMLNHHNKKELSLFEYLYTYRIGIKTAWAIVKIIKRNKK